MPFERGSTLFVAREQEQEQVLGAVLAGRGAAIVGPAGIGKTALLSAVTRRLNAARFGVVWTAATEASREVPFSVFRGLVGIDDRLDYSRAYGLVRAELTRRAGGRVPVVVIDDVHHLDNWSATLTLGLAGEGDVRLVVAAQSGPSTSDAVLALWKDGYLGRLDMAPLSPAGSAELVNALVGAETARSTMDILYQWTGGNPLFLTELVRHARATRQLVVAGGLWWWRGALALPPGLADLFDRRLRGLAPAHQDALAAVAMGEPLSLPVLDAVAPGVVESLEDQGLVCTAESDGQITVRLGQPMLGAAVWHRLPRLRRRRLAAALLGVRTPTTPDPVTLARWQLDASGPVDAGLLIRAAEATCRHDPELARGFARRALARSSAAAVPLAAALVELGNPDEARQVLDQARDAATTPGGRLRLAIALAAHRCWVDRDPAGAADELVGLRSRTAAPWARAAVDGAHALVLLFDGRTATALRIAERLLHESARGPGVAAARLALATSLALTGATADAVALTGIAAADNATPAYLSGLMAAVRAFTDVWRASEPRLPASDPAYGRWPSAGRPQSTEWTLLGGYLQWVRGNRQDAIARLREAVVQQSGGQRLFRTEATCWLAVCLAEDRQPDSAERALAAGRPDGVAVLPGQVQWARAAVAVARGNLTAASTSIRDAVAAARAAGCWAVEVEYLTYAAWLVPSRPPADIADRLALAARHVDASRLVAGAAAVLALHRGDGAELLDHAIRLDTLGMRGEARRLAELAAAALREQGGGRRGDAVVLASRLRDRLGVTRPAAPLAALTAREMEIAALAAGGLPDREISRRLAVSVRTVESHLTRVYRKLDVHSRRDLPPVLDRG
ncbi:MAG TPA: LuxR C-terminal-related transcriptional regulator [Pseudonocardiaceae bacterium]